MYELDVTNIFPILLSYSTVLNKFGADEFKNWCIENNIEIMYELVGMYIDNNKNTIYVNESGALEKIGAQVTQILLIKTIKFKFKSISDRNLFRLTWS